MTAILTRTSDQAGIMIEKAGTAITSIQGATGEDSALIYQMTKTLAELEMAARSTRILSETLEHNPEAILFGKKSVGRK